MIFGASPVPPCGLRYAFDGPSEEEDGIGGDEREASDSVMMTGRCALMDPGVPGELALADGCWEPDSSLSGTVIGVGTRDDTCC